MTKIHERYYQPQLLWGYVKNYILTNIPDDEQSNRPQLFIFLHNQTGAYYMHNQKLYFDPELGDGYFENTSQNALHENTEELAEVQLFCHDNKNDDPITWKSFEAFISDMTQ